MLSGSQTYPSTKPSQARTKMKGGSFSILSWEKRDSRVMAMASSKTPKISNRGGNRNVTMRRDRESHSALAAAKSIDEKSNSKYNRENSEDASAHVLRVAHGKRNRVYRRRRQRRGAYCIKTVLSYCNVYFVLFCIVLCLSLPVSDSVSFALLCHSTTPIPTTRHPCSYSCRHLKRS